MPVPEDLAEAGACFARDDPIMVARRAEVEARAGMPAVALPAARIGDDVGGLRVWVPDGAGNPDVEGGAAGGGTPAVDADGSVCAAHAPPPMRRAAINAGASKLLFMTSLRGRIEGFILSPRG